MEIEEIIMRIPGIGKEEGESLAAEVSRRLSRHSWNLPSGFTVPSLHLRLESGGDSSTLAQRITTSLISQIESHSTRSNPSHHPHSPGIRPLSVAEGARNPYTPTPEAR